MDNAALAMVAPGVWTCAQCGATDANLRYVGDRNIGCEKCLTFKARVALDRLGYARPRTCCRWSGSGGECATCHVAAYDHPGAPTPAQRGCQEFILKGSVGVGLGDAARCEFCLLPARDHRVEKPPKISWQGDAHEAQAITVTLTLAAPSAIPMIAACESARLFLADLTDLSVADAREASELRHGLRRPSMDMLRATVLFLGGVHPARQGQAALVGDLLGLLRPEMLSRAIAESRLDRSPDGRTNAPRQNEV